MGQDSLGSFATAAPTSLNFIPQSASDWCVSEGNPPCVSLDLTPWETLPNIRLVFKTYNRFGNNIFVDNIAVNGTLSVTEEFKTVSDNIAVFSNPTSESFTLTLNDITGPVTLMVSDLSGRLVYQTSFDSNGNTQRSIDMTDNGKGIYIVEIHDNKNVWVKKVAVK